GTLVGGRPPLRGRGSLSSLRSRRRQSAASDRDPLRARIRRGDRGARLRHQDRRPSDRSLAAPGRPGGPPGGRGPGAAYGGRAQPEPEPSSTLPAAEAVADFLRRMRVGIEDGLDPMNAAQRAAGELPKTLREALERVALRLRGEYREDEWGFDEGFAEAVYPAFEFLYDVWWRVEAEGVRNVPAHGRALLVANHAGSLFPFDASMILGAIMKQHPLPRWPPFMVLDWAFALPFLSTFLRPPA